MGPHSQSNTLPREINSWCQQLMHSEKGQGTQNDRTNGPIGKVHKTCLPQGRVKRRNGS